MEKWKKITGFILYQKSCEGNLENITPFSVYFVSRARADISDEI
jgi:hypothetical protein